MGQPDAVDTAEAEITLHAGTRGQIGGGGPTDRLSGYNKKFYDTCHKKLKDLYEKSAKAAENSARYPLLDLYAGLYKPRGGDQEAVEGKQNPDPVPDTYVHYAVKDELRTKFTEESFPVSIAEYFIGKEGKLKAAAAEWVFADKSATAQPAADQNVSAMEMYNVHALIDLYAKGMGETKHRTAGDKVVFFCEGRLKPAISLKTELFHRVQLYLAETFTARSQSTHPLAIDQFKNKRVEGLQKDNKTWQDEFSYFVKIYNENIYAKEIGRDDSKWKILEDLSNVENVYTQWLIYWVVSKYFTEEEGRAILYEEVIPDFDQASRTLEAAVTDILYGRGELPKLVEKAEELIGRKLQNGIFRGDPLTEREKSDLQNAYDVVFSSANRLRREVEKSERLLHELMRNFINEKHLNYDKLDLKRFARSAEDAMSPYVNESGILINTPTKDTKKEIKFDDTKYSSIAEKAAYFIRTIFDPVIYSVVSLGILTIILRKYSDYLSRVANTCNFLVNQPAPAAP